MPIFKRITKDKSGYEYIEAAFVLPITTLIVAAILGIMVLMFQEVVVQTEEHEKMEEEAYSISETEKIRALDKIQSEILSEMESYG